MPSVVGRLSLQLTWALSRRGVQCVRCSEKRYLRRTIRRSRRKSSHPAPLQPVLSLEVIGVEDGKAVADYLGGRICHIGDGSLASSALPTFHFCLADVPWASEDCPAGFSRGRLGVIRVITCSP